jgi:AcrR family transcriptional regulator
MCGQSSSRDQPRPCNRHRIRGCRPVVTTVPVFKDTTEERQAIVLAAYECIAQHGADGLRLRDVIAEASVNASTIRQHFPRTRDLLVAVLEYSSQQLRYAVLAAIETRARRDPLLRSAVQRSERAWRASLVSLFRSGMAEQAWANGVDAHAAAELVIAAVKGVRLSPGSAAGALDQLTQILVNNSAHAHTVYPERRHDQR